MTKEEALQLKNGDRVIFEDGYTFHKYEGTVICYACNGDKVFIHANSGQGVLVKSEVVTKVN